MMKIKLFDIREDEKNFAYNWGKVNNHEIVCVEEHLTLDNVSSLKDNQHHTWSLEQGL